MRKIVSIVVALMALFFLSFTSSMAEWTAGVSVSHGAYEAGGSESEDGEKNTAKREEAAFTYPEIFFEYNLGRVSLGLGVIPGSVSTNEQTRTDINVDAGNDGGTSGVTNKVSVELSRHVSLYALVPITDIGTFARLQVMRVEVETKESLGTGSKYPDTHMTGASLSLGYQYDTAGGFIRAEVGYTDYEGISVSASNTNNTVEGDVDGQWGRISIGRSF